MSDYQVPLHPDIRPDKWAGVSASTLLGSDLVLPPFVVDELLPIGLNLLAAPSKVGKTWLAGQLSGVVSCVEGGKLFDRFTINPGRAAYFDLEQAPPLTKRRAHAIEKGLGLPLDQVDYFHQAPRIGEGMRELLDRVFKGDVYPQTGPASLVVIDTATHIWPRIKRSVNAYVDESEWLASLNRIATDNNSALLLVHHMSKAKFNDPVDAISGSAAWQGQSQSMWIIKRSRTETLQGVSDAELFIVSRWCKGYTIDLEWRDNLWHGVVRP